MPLTSNPTVTGETRSLGTSFQVSSDFPAQVSYTVDLAVNNQDCQVELFIGPSDPPTESAGRVKASSLVLLGLISIAVESSGMLFGWVPTGHYVRLATTGAGTATLVGSVELVFG